MRGLHRQRQLLAEDWYDVAFTAVLTALALVAWAPTYRGAGLWFIGLGALLVGLAVAVVVVALGAGTEYAALALVFVYVVASGPVAGGLDALVGLDALGAGTQSTLEGWRLLTGTHPPLDASGAAVLPVALLCLLGAGITAALAMRSDVPGRPLLPQLLLLVAVLVLGRAETAGVLVHGLLFVAVSLVWLRVRAQQSEHAEAATRGGPVWSQVGAGAAMVLVAGLLATLFSVSGLTGGTPLVDRHVLRGELPAYDPASVRTPLDSFRDYTRRRPPPEGNVFDARLLRVRGAEAGTRLRFAALDRYDGNRWRAAEGTDPVRIDDRYLRLSSTVDNPGRGDPAELVVTALGGWALPWVPTAGTVQAFSFLGPQQDVLADELRFSPAAGSGLVTGTALEPGTDYVVDALLPVDDEVTADLVPSSALDERLYDAGAFLDPAVQAWSAGADSPVQAVLRVARQLKRSGRYSDGAVRGEQQYAAGHSERRLGPDFVLAQPSVGNDEQYAAAMALMANRLRVPARVVVGAVVPGNGIVQGDDVQAWVELRVADGSWRTLPTEAFMGRRPPPPDAQDDPESPPPPRIFPEQTPDDASPPQQQPQQPDPPQPEDAEQPDDAEDAEEDGGLVGTVLRVLLVVLLVVALAAAVPGVKYWRRRRRRTAELASDRYAGAWAELCDTARDLGRPVPPGLTRPAQARVLTEPVLGTDRPAAPLEVRTLAREADVRIFGAEEPSPADAEAFWALVDDQRSGLAALHSPVRRLRALFSLASLRSRGPR